MPNGIDFATLSQEGLQVRNERHNAHLSTTSLKDFIPLTYKFYLVLLAVVYLFGTINPSLVLVLY